MNPKCPPPSTRLRTSYVKVRYLRKRLVYLYLKRKFYASRALQLNLVFLFEKEKKNYPNLSSNYRIIQKEKRKKKKPILPIKYEVWLLGNDKWFFCSFRWCDASFRIICVVLSPPFEFDNQKWWRQEWLFHHFMLLGGRCSYQLFYANGSMQSFIPTHN